MIVAHVWSCPSTGLILSNRLNRPKQTKSQRQECVLNYFADQMVGIWAIETGSIAAIENWNENNLNLTSEW